MNSAMGEREKQVGEQGVEGEEEIKWSAKFIINPSQNTVWKSEQ